MLLIHLSTTAAATRRQAFPLALEASDDLLTLEPDVPTGSAAQRADWFEGLRCTNTDTLDITFMLQHSAEQSQILRETLHRISDPTSADYGRHLTRAQVTNLSATPAAVTAVRSFLAAAGIDGATVRTGQTRDTVHVRSLACPLAEQLLSTEIHRYTHAELPPVLRASRTYALPRRVAAHVALVAPLLRLPPLSARQRRSQQTKAAWWVPLGGSGGDAYLGYEWPDDCGKSCYGTYESGRAVTPEVLKQQYRLGERPDQSAHGSMAVASFQGEFWDQEGLDTYAAKCQIPPLEIVHNNGSHVPEVCTSVMGSAMGFCMEAMMDIEMIKAVGGGVPLSTYYRWQYSIERWAVGLNELPDGELPLVHSVSYGDDEVDQRYDSPLGQSGLTYMDAVDEELIKLGLRGATIIFASGDMGVWGRTGVKNGDRFHPDYPGASPYVTSVGGTDLKVKNILGDGERAWSGSGGGFSSRVGAPLYQKAAIEAFIGANGSSSSGHLPPAELWNASGRGYPDVAVLGGAENPYCVTVEQDWYGAYGTSASAPVFAGIVAKLNDLRLRAGRPPMGFINPFLYANPSAFRDVVFGDNKDKGYTGFRAIPGWDAATGLGAPDYEKLAEVAMALHDAR
mmetsp:Transcript_22555/g.60499  ORF Transcript_22555/g.60499 Transcript_22555/m.60499 type:complete len:623 (+) Transcript_22555:28-1896(+)